MMNLLVFKEKLRRFYGRYSLYLIPVIKFFVGFLAAWLINSNLARDKICGAIVAA